MKTQVASLTKKDLYKVLLLDLVAIVFVYFIPALSHLTALPFYLIEPMRIMIILAMAHTNRSNAMVLALTLPLFSFAVSGHPELPKVFLMMFELALSVGLFYFLKRFLANTIVVALVSIIASKMVYYLLKYVFISSALLDMSLISTPIWIQLLTSSVFALYLWGAIDYFGKRQKVK